MDVVVRVVGVVRVVVRVCGVVSVNKLWVSV